MSRTLYFGGTRFMISVQIPFLSSWAINFLQSGLSLEATLVNFDVWDNFSEADAIAAGLEVPPSHRC